MMDNTTQQFMYRSFIWLVVGVIAGIFGFVFAVAWREGDGEAVRLAGQFAPVAISAFLSIGGVLGLHTVVGGSVAKANINSASPSPDTTTIPAPPVVLATSDL